MSKFVDEIIDNIKTQPDKWQVYNRYHNGIRCDSIKITGIGNGPLISIAHVYIDVIEMPLTFKDKYRLEKVVTWWFRNVSIKHLTETK